MGNFFEVVEYGRRPTFVTKCIFGLLPAIMFASAISAIIIAAQFDKSRSLCSSMKHYTVDLDIFLYVAGCIQICHLVLDIFILYLRYQWKQTERYLCLNIVLYLFIFVWIIIGLIIYNEQMSADCQNESIGAMILSWCIIRLVYGTLICCVGSLVCVRGCNPSYSYQYPCEYDERINRQLEKLSKEDIKMKKVLILGTQGSGKSTLMKQIRFIYGEGYTDQEKLGLRQDIIYQCQHTIEEIHRILIDLGQENIEQYIDWYNNNKVEYIQNLWNISYVKEIYEQRSRFGYLLSDSTGYFMDDIARIYAGGIPHDLDILRLSSMNIYYYGNCNIREEYVNVESERFSFVLINIDHCGEIRKWSDLLAFDQMNTIFYVIDISSYDRFAYDILSKEDVGLLIAGYVDYNEHHIVPIEVMTIIYHYFGLWVGGQNMLVQAVDLYEEVIHCDAFKDKEIMVFLNKVDLFQKKQTPLDICDVFDGYDGSGKTNDYEGCIAYFEDALKSKVVDKHRVIRVFRSSLLDNDTTRKCLNDAFSFV